MPLSVLNPGEHKRGDEPAGETVREVTQRAVDDRYKQAGDLQSAERTAYIEQYEKNRAELKHLYRSKLADLEKQRAAMKRAQHQEGIAAGKWLIKEQEKIEEDYDLDALAVQNPTAAKRIDRQVDREFRNVERDVESDLHSTQRASRRWYLKQRNNLRTERDQSLHRLSRELRGRRR